MGLYTNYENVQLKVCDRTMKTYLTGDRVPIPDGVYVGLEGVVVIDKGRLARVYDKLYSKHGRVLDKGEVIRAETERTPGGMPLEVIC